MDHILGVEGAHVKMLHCLFPGLFLFGEIFVNGTLPGAPPFSVEAGPPWCSSWHFGGLCGLGFGGHDGPCVLAVSAPLQCFWFHLSWLSLDHLGLVHTERLGLLGQLEGIYLVGLAEPLPLAW